MFKEIIKAFRRENVVEELTSQLEEMLQAGRWMFDRATEVLAHNKDWQVMSDELYARDKQINALEQRIRERIVTHLSLGNQADLAACLALMSIVKDAERIGDYCKNIFEVGRFYREPYQHPEYMQPLTEICQEVSELFERTREAFTTSRGSLAKEILQVVNGITERCDMLIRQLLSVHEDIAPDEAVAYVLLARHYKRVACHLANVATSVLSPVPMLDFRH